MERTSRPLESLCSATPANVPPEAQATRPPLCCAQGLIDKSIHLPPPAMFCRSSSSSSPSSSSSLPCSAQNPRPHPHAFHSASPTAQCTPTLDYNDPQFPHMATYQSPEDDAELERKLQENDRIQRIRNEMRKHHQGGDNLLDPQFPQVIEKVKKSKVEWTAMLQEMEAKALRDEEREKKGERVADIIDLEILEIVEDYGYVDSLPESQWYDYIGGDSDSAEEEEEEDNDDDDDDEGAGDSAKEEDEEDGKSDSVQVSVQRQKKKKRKQGKLKANDSGISAATPTPTTHDQRPELTQ
ncbi:hypothetical protein BKA80DRAFT_71707 [Phyllosticta citrichinensis]